MNFQDIPADILTIRVKRTDKVADALQEQPVFSVEASLTRPDEFDIRLKSRVVFVLPIIAADTRRLNSELASGRAILAQLANPAVDGSIELHIAFFTGECLEMGEVDIGVDEYVEDAIARSKRRKVLKGEPLYRRLHELCCFRQGDNEFFFLTAGPAIDAELKPEPVTPDEDDNAQEDGNDLDESDESEPDAEVNTVGDNAMQTPKPAPTRKNSFCVTGDGIRFVATKTALPDGSSILTVTRLTKGRNDPDRALRLAKGKLAFVDWTRAGRLQILAKEQMTDISRDDDGYLKQWDEFGDLEGELLLKHARELGALQYCDMQQNRDGTVSVRIAQAADSALNALATGRVPEVEVVDDLPDYLTNQSLSFKDFVGGIEKEAEDQSFFGRRERQKTKAYFKVSRFDAESKTLTLKAERLPFGSGTLVLSLVGETTQIKRRIAAHRAILDGRAVNPQLGPLIKEKGTIVPTRSQHKLRPLTAFVRAKVFRNPPTVMQERAIEVALNTPDIALIQGPPGTGKTTVIAAILERLNEMADKRGASTKGQVLLTGFQHDAVENMIERLSLNGIPVPKFGGRSGADDDDFGGFEKSLEEWCSKRAAELRKRNPQIVEIERETEIKNLCLQYVQSPTRALAAHLTRQIASLGVPVLDEDGARWAANLARNLSHEERLNEESNQLLSAVRGLRIRRESFEDDGPERATDALDDLKDVIEDGERSLLDKASLWRHQDGVPAFLEAMAALKKALLIRFATPPVFRVEKQSDEVLALAEMAIKRIKTAGYSAKDQKSAALAEFLAELENNPYGMIEAVSDYSFAFAATCQQSVNRKMQIQKGLFGNSTDHKMEYEFVIVDEAARVSPRDLMIPMAQGKRIILVGDHRQLPHLIDDNVIKALSEEEEESVLATESEVEHDPQNWSKVSLFEHMFVTRLPALEEQDRIIRRVTLDKQYRMHPLLGDFISRNFYERFDRSEKFGSGRPVSDFVHDLPGTDGKPAVWLDVPAAKGKQERQGTSWTRPVEATAIAQQLQAWLKSEAGKNLSFGVISFYKAQAELIKRQMDNITDDTKKLRIGTVDSFQGMEFDVVFLSMVRTLPRQWTSNDDSREKQARGLFGHLCLYNRLNVSMSRQKKLLVVAGDSGVLHNELAAEFIPGLVDFRKLCDAEGRVFQCR